MELGDGITNLPESQFDNALLLWLPEVPPDAFELESRPSLSRLMRLALSCLLWRPRILLEVSPGLLQLLSAFVVFMQS